jgi:hypothetical protein
MKVIRTTEGYMVELENGDYLCDLHDDNLWDTRAEAEEVIAQAQGKPTTVDMSDPRIMMHEAAHAFYEWEKGRYNGNSPMSDDDRLTWMQGYVYAYAKLTGVNK